MDDLGPLFIAPHEPDRMGIAIAILAVAVIGVSALALIRGRLPNAFSYSVLLLMPVFGYALGAYLIEGRPKTCVPFFRAVGEAKTVDLEPIVQKHLGFDVAALEVRVLRWLEETTWE